MSEPPREPDTPGEVRSPIQVVVRVVLAIILIAVLIGVAWALVRLVSRSAAGSPTPALVSSASHRLTFDVTTGDEA